jgi:hypothetical protein
MVRHEERIEPPALERLSETLQVLEVEIRVWIGAGMAPPTRMDAYRAHEGAEAQLPVSHWNLILLIGESQPKPSVMTNACPEGRSLDKFI